MIANFLNRLLLLAVILLFLFLLLNLLFLLIFLLILRFLKLAIFALFTSRILALLFYVDIFFFAFQNSHNFLKAVEISLQIQLIVAFHNSIAINRI